MSLYSMAFLGLVPVGSLPGGTLADRLGAPLTVRIAGGACILWLLASSRCICLARGIAKP